MKKRAREPFLICRTINMILGIIILVLVVLIFSIEENRVFFEMLTFGLAAVVHFLAATIAFTEKKMIRANIYSVLCVIFLVIAIIIALGFYGVI